MEKKFLKGCNALGEALVRGGCRFYCGYPITPVSELLEYMSWRLAQVGGTFLQVESEIAAVNMVHGAAATGTRSSSASSGPGMSLMQEGISYISGSELPCLLVDIMRDGPGLGGVSPAQTDYFMATRGGGHGPYRTIVLAPSTAQEMVNMVSPAYRLAEKYMMPVILLADAMLGQAYEAVVLPEMEEPPRPPAWAIRGAGDGPRHKFPEFFSGEKLNLKLQEKYRVVAEREKQFEFWGDRCEDLLLVAFGTTARICKEVVHKAAQEGIHVGLFRPITLFPFPYGELQQSAKNTGKILVVEMSPGQLIDDVRIAEANRKEIHFYGRLAGIVPTSDEIMIQVRKIAKGGK